MLKKRRRAKRASDMCSLHHPTRHLIKVLLIVAGLFGLLVGLVLFFSAPVLSWRVVTAFVQPGLARRFSLPGELLLPLISVIVGGWIWGLLWVTGKRHSDRTTRAIAPADQHSPEPFHASSNLLPQSTPLMTISLLKRVQVRLHLPNGLTREVALRKGEHGIRLILLAYIVWRRGKPVDRDKILTYVFARGRRREMEPSQLSEAFDAAKKFLREDLKRAIHAVNKEAGQELIAEQAVGFFQHDPGFYRLHPCCRVEDLERIEQLYQTIHLARKEGLLDEKVDGSIPPWVVAACQQLLQAYPGDFLEELMEKFPDAFGPWVREPVTRYRDCYLDALWILATYERALGQHYVDESLSTEQNEERRRHHQGKAAQLYYEYALFAINSRVDSKLKFAYRAGKDGERVVMSQRAIRRCVILLGCVGKIGMIDQTYLTYKDKMSLLSEGQWRPEKETERDVMQAKRRMQIVQHAAPAERSGQNMA